MVGYPESITDPSYQGQILVITFPIVGNYGVPPRQTIVDGLHAYFESSRIHIAGLVVATYCEEYSHYLATCALGEWLKEQGIPGIWGVDTRALTKKIRVKGSMLGRLRQSIPGEETTWEQIEWEDPNLRNLVAEGSPFSFKSMFLQKSPLRNPSYISHIQMWHLNILLADLFVSSL